LLTDEAYVVGAGRYASSDDAPFRHWYVLGAGVALWVCWQITSVIGIAAGTAVPESWELEFALPLTFIAIIVPALRDRPALAAAVVAAAIATAGHTWPYSTGLFTAAVAGMAAGLALDRTLRGPRHAPPGAAEAA
jgi:predicted branched-subunit amino acid permease